MRHTFCVFLALIVSFFAVAASLAEPDAPNADIAFTPGETTDFAFQSNGLMLSGIINVPATEPKALMVMIHSYGQTNVREWDTYSKQRRLFNEMGVTTVIWDKPGQGRSEGVFDINQPVQESAVEALDAIALLRSIGAPGSQTIILWGGSRAGWIAPLALAEDRSLKYWISISGTGTEDNYTYLLLSNLPHEGGSEALAESYAQEFRAGCEALRTGGPYEAFLDATSNLRADEYISSMRSWPTRSEYLEIQKSCQDGSCAKMENEMCSYVPVDDFPGLVASLDVDVLALFGEKDLHVDWRKTKRFYEDTFGANPEASLTIHSFADADHGLNVAETGSLREMRERTTRPSKTEGYFDVQAAWLKEYVLNDK